MGWQEIHVLYLLEKDFTVYLCEVLLIPNGNCTLVDSHVDV